MARSDANDATGGKSGIQAPAAVLAEAASSQNPDGRGLSAGQSRSRSVSFGMMLAIVGRLPAIVGRPPAIVGRLPAIVGKPPAIIGRPLAFVGRPPSFVGRQTALDRTLPVAFG